MQFTFTITDSEDAKRLEEDLRRDARIYTRTKKANGQSNVGKQFTLTPLRSTTSHCRVRTVGFCPVYDAVRQTAVKALEYMGATVACAFGPDPRRLGYHLHNRHS
jgi:hypothetical protein